MNNGIIWTDVVGYEGLYELSNNGLVRTKEGKKTYIEYHGWIDNVIRRGKTEVHGYKVLELDKSNI